MREKNSLRARLPCLPESRASVLNIHSTFDGQSIETVWQRPLRTEMSEPPGEEELCEATGKREEREAAGRKGFCLRW